MFFNFQKDYRWKKFIFVHIWIISGGNFSAFLEFPFFPEFLTLERLIFFPGLKGGLRFKNWERGFWTEIRG